MGRPSPQLKKAKRQKQKVRRKLKFNRADDRACVDNCGNSEEATDIDVNNYCAVDEEEVIGEDMDTLQMKLADSIMNLSKDPDKHKPEYLEECRRKLITKVDTYTVRLEKAYSENAKLAYKHRREIESLRSFYQSIIHLPTRTGRIVKVAKSNTSAAREVLEQVGLNYRLENGDTYYVH